jgi:microcystin-dependent protein
MFTENPFRKSLLVALCLPGVALASLPIARAQQRVPVQPTAARQVSQGSTPSPGDVEKMLVIAAATRMPAGAILPFAGETPPPGYLLCDGTEVLRDDYPALFAAIGTSWGFDTNFTFTMPDLRGRFLRGVDGGAGNDPDAVSRSAINSGGNVGDEVGSLQGDGRRGFSGTFAGTTSTNGDHSHTISTNQDDFDECCAGISWANDGGGSGIHKSTNSAGAHSHTTSTTVTFNGESETRPKNANVNFIIKI